MVLREIEQRSVKETAQILGTSISAVKARLFHGRQRFAQGSEPQAPARSLRGQPGGNPSLTSDSLSAFWTMVQMRRGTVAFVEENLGKSAKK